MSSLNYKEESNRFLTKNFAESFNPQIVYHINITINDEVLTAITGYDLNNHIVKTPDIIIDKVKNDINKALGEYM